MKRILYLGLSVPENTTETIYIHCPIIEIIPKEADDSSIVEAFNAIDRYTHILFTSQSSVKIFFEYLSSPINATIIAVGKSTARSLEFLGAGASIIAKNETAEGIVEELEKLPKEKTSLFWPRSALARPVISEAVKRLGLTMRETIFYETKTRVPSIKPDLSTIDEIFFTSPSTVDGFFEVFGEIPQQVRIQTIGPITEKHLKWKLTLAIH